MVFHKHSIAKLFFILLPVFFLSSCVEKTEAGKKETEEPANVEVLLVEPRTVTKNYTASAILEGNEEAIVTSAISGEIRKFYVREGAYVKSGERMALIDPADYALELKIAEALAKGRRQTYKRVASLLGKKAVSDAEFDLAETELKLAEAGLEKARLNLERTIIKSPIAGQVTLRQELIGKRVMPGDILFRVVNIDRMKMTIALSEKEVVHLYQDEDVKVLVDAWPGERFPGRIRSVRVSPDAATASFPVEIELERDRRLKPGMVARVTLKGEVFRDLLLVPTEAVFERIGSYYLFVYKDGYARLREVERGRRFGELIEIKSGIKTGDEIIPVYGPRLKEGTPVNPVKRAQTDGLKPSIKTE